MPVIEYQKKWLEAVLTLSKQLTEGFSKPPLFNDQLWRDYPTTETARLLNAGNAHFLLATEGKTLAGMVCIIMPASDNKSTLALATVEKLVVDRQWRRQGIGGQLMDAAERWAREHGAQGLILDVFAGNEPAQSFYERHGWRQAYATYQKPLD